MRKLGSIGRRLAAPPPRVLTSSGATSGFQRLDGRSSTERGYGSDWRRVRAAILAAEPLCRMCAAEGRVTIATEVDHIQPFTSLDDPRRLDPTNLRPLCAPCHRSRTARQAHGALGRGGIDL
jgi:hypothetical protein